MSERSDPQVTPLRLVLDSGETVELNDSILYDPAAETTIPAVVLRMPPHRAAYLGQVLNAYTLVCRIVGIELDAAERGPAWALAQVASAAGFVDATTPPFRPQRVPSKRRVAAGAALKQADDIDDVTMIAVIDAAARWLEETDGDGYAYALLGAVTDPPTQSRAFAELLGRSGDDA